MKSSRSLLDIPQALAQKGMTQIANTGYGWGYRWSVGLSEQLMLNFTKQLVEHEQIAVGKALVAAKRKYYLNRRNFNFYDEKILVENTLYGLPMYRFAPTRVRPASTGLPEGFVPRERGHLGDGALTTNHIDFELPPLEKVTTENGDYYKLGEQIHAVAGESIQPKLPFNVSTSGTQAHGLVFKNGVYSDVISFDPVIEEGFTLTLQSGVTSTFTTTNWYPADFFQLNTLNDGAEATLVILIGQYMGSETNGTLPLYQEVSFDIYYHTDSDDWTQPTISHITSELNGSTATVTVATSDTSGIETVVVAYTDGTGSWQSNDLTDGGEAWSGTFTANENTQFFVQAVDKAGNVAVDDNDGQYYTAVETNSATALTCQVELEGRPTPPDARWSVPLRVTLIALGATEPAYSFTPTTDEYGIFTVSGIELGSYELRVKKSTTLQNLLNVTLVEGDNNLDCGTLFEGDANDDNFVILSDFGILANTFGTCEGAANYDACADFNGDGCVILNDFGLLSNNFGKSGQ